MVTSPSPALRLAASQRHIWWVAFGPQRSAIRQPGGGLARSAGQADPSKVFGPLLDDVGKFATKDSNSAYPDGRPLRGGVASSCSSGEFLTRFEGMAGERAAQSRLGTQINARKPMEWR